MLKSTDKMVARRLLREIAFSRLHFRLIMVVIAILAACFGLLGPFFQKEFIDHLTGSPLAMDHLWPSLKDWLPESPLAFLLAAFVSVLLSLACSQAVTYMAAREAIVIQRRWSQSLYEKILSLRADSWAGRPVGEIVSIYTTDVPGATILLEQSLPQAFNIVFPLLLAPILIVGLFGIPIGSALELIVGIVMLNLILALRQSRFFYRFKKLAADRIGLVNEWIQNMRTLRILGWTRAFEKRIFHVREIETQNRISMLNNGQFMNAVAASITFVLNLVLIAGLVQGKGGQITPGSLLALLWIVAIFLTRPFRQMPWFFTFLFDGTSSLNRTAALFAMTNSEPHSRHLDFQKLSPPVPGEAALSISNLNLKINGKAVLQNLNFKIQAGEFVAVVGEVGSGKSLLLLSLLGETGAHYADYKIGSNDAKQMPLDQLRQYFTYIPQEGFIMSASLRENVAFEYDIPATRDVEIQKALHNSQFSFVQERVREGLNTDIGERGVNLSGGQKQRVSLARVDFDKAPIILLDDCLSAVDIDTERKILSSLILGAWKERTRILATHRLTVLDRVDRVLFLKNGQLQAQGTYQELLATNSEFREYTVSVRETP